MTSFQQVTQMVEQRLKRYVDYTHARKRGLKPRQQVYVQPDLALDDARVDMRVTTPIILSSGTYMERTVLKASVMDGSAGIAVHLQNCSPRRDRVVTLLLPLSWDALAPDHKQGMVDKLFAGLLGEVTWRRVTKEVACG